MEREEVVTSKVTTGKRLIMGYSAEVDLLLIIGERVIQLCKSAPDFIAVREPITLPECNATLVVIVDEKRREYPVMISACNNEKTIWYTDI